MSIQDGSYIEGYSVGHCDLCRKGANNRLYFLSGQRFCAVCFPAAVNIKIANEKLKPTPKTYSAAKVQALMIAAEAVTGWVWWEILRYAECETDEILADINKLEAAIAAMKRGEE